MKNHLTILIVAFASFFTTLSCKVEPVVVLPKLSKSAIAGIWDGRYVNAGQPDTPFVRFKFQQNDTFTTAPDTIAAHEFKGNYAIINDSLIADLYLSGDSIKFRFGASNNNTRLDGIWYSMNFPAHKTIYLDKQ